MWVDLPLQEGIAPREQLVAAIRTARKLGRIPIVDLSAPWCGPCRLAKRFMKGPGMGAIAQHMYVISLNVDNWEDALGKLGFGATIDLGIPRMFVIDRTGRPVGEPWRPKNRNGPKEVWDAELKALCEQAQRQFQGQQTPKGG